ncbi:DUF6503 family protein [Jiulongibacter sediminis]|jgi:hypothetical protein|uniref:DUF6503 family protein n=1 Tax=Jiulongibacter sediminis TaxID=1605367 RepID=UPI0026F00EF9|nr:DUF6503 family protein [Jiulongibacter sediminis]
MKQTIILIFLSITLWSCSSKEDQIIRQTISAHGGEAYKDIHVTFDFRGMHYDFTKNGGLYSYQRIQNDSLGNVISDILNNETFTRTINGEVQNLPDSIANKYSNSVNSVAYFFMLPDGLNDPAVNKELTGTVKIKGQSYHQLKVWFDEQGGGKDHQDIFMFWINEKTNLIDYLAYSYETSGGGVRFREVIERHLVGEFTFQDYNNYGFEDAEYPLSDLPLALEDGSLPLLSEIRNENIQLLK